ncbi:MAG: DUF1844 domain-containing protein [Bryobacterales bacterium]
MSDAEETRPPEEPKVKVSDRRRFTAEGQARDPAEVDPEPAAAKAPETGTPLAGSPATPPGSAASSPHPQTAPEPPRAQARGRGVPPASIELLVLSLAMQAQMELGLGEPQEGHVPNLDIARHTIDLLAILQQKTKGNLTLDEQRLLENTLTELRYRYVQALETINQRAKA